MIDFDGTITKKNEFPKIGELRPGAIEGIKKLQSHGWKCCLWTCRTGATLEAAIDFLESQGLKMDGYNESPYDNRNFAGRKPIADVYIDDASFPSKFNKSWLDWGMIVETLLHYYSN